MQKNIFLLYQIFWLYMVSVFFQIIKLLGGETSQDQPAVAMAAGSIRGDVNGGTGISNTTENTTG